MASITEEQRTQTMDAYNKCGGNKADAAKMLKIPYTTFRSRYDICMRDSSVQQEKLEKYIPEGQKLRGVSTFYNGAGDVVGQWVKTKEDLDAQLEMMRQVAEELVKSVPKAKPVKPPKGNESELLSLYPITDFHLGMMAKAGESGEEWNTDKAAQFLIDWFSYSINKAPPSHKAVFWQGGDFFHYDSLDAVTPTSRHLMDTDTRYQELTRTGVRVLKTVIAMLLEKHKEVHVIMAEGNHDIASSVWLRLMFSELYANEKRITFDTGDNPYYAVEWGKTGLVFHHGHKQKVQSASKLFAGLYREMFGRCPYFYAHMGDKHHRDLKEDHLMEVEQHPTLATKDAYSARNGYMSKRAASVITYHKEYGEKERFTVRPEMLCSK